MVNHCVDVVAVPLCLWDVTKLHGSHCLCGGEVRPQPIGSRYVARDLGLGGMRDECTLRACRLPCTPLRAVGPLLGILLARLERNWLERLERLLLKGVPR